MRILFLTASQEDYLSDSLLLGLRKIYGIDLIDYPRRDILYSDCHEVILRQVRGHGFTLYTGLLSELSIDRFLIEPKLKENQFDLVVISDIWRQFGYFLQWRQYLRPENTILIDGADTPQVYPYAGLWLRQFHLWSAPRATRGFLYFKREWTEDSRFNLWHRFLPAAWRTGLPHYPGLRRISFSIPEEKVVRSLPVKTKDFPRHIVDERVAAVVPGSLTSYAFTSEAAYYADLQASRFGITTRKAGWDCLRHYEIAANGTVPCFRDLPTKPVDCAPHGLIPGRNCLAYREPADLLHQIKRMTDGEYRQLQQGALEWVRSKSTRALAAEVVAEWRLVRERGLAGQTGKSLGAAANSSTGKV